MCTCTCIYMYTICYDLITNQSMVAKVLYSMCTYYKYTLCIMRDLCLLCNAYMYV